MKKYWKLIGLTLFVVIVLSIFFYQSEKVSTYFPQFHVEHAEGDATEIENVLLYGDYYKGMYTFESFKVDLAGTYYLRDESLLSRFSLTYLPFEIERLQQEYRSFMRGKEANPAMFYEDDERLVYGGTPYDMIDFENYFFEIDVLHKATDERISFLTPIPDRNNFWHVEPYYVTANEREVKVITVNERTDYESETDTTEIHLYTFDLEKEELVTDEVIFKLENEVSDYAGYTFVDVIKNAKIHDELLFVQYEYVYADNHQSDTLVEERIVHYDVANNEQTEIDIDVKELGKVIAFDESFLYGTYVENNTVILTKHDTKIEAVVDRLDIAVHHTYFHLEDFAHSVIDGNKLYFVSSEEPVSLFVIDTDSFTIAYSGELVNENPLDPNADEEYFIYDVTLK